DDARSVERDPLGLRQLARLARAYGSEERKPVALGLLQHVRAGPHALMRIDRKRERVATAHLGVGDRQLRAGWLLPVRVRVAADPTGRPQHGQRELATLEQL